MKFLYTKIAGLPTGIYILVSVISWAMAALVTNRPDFALPLFLALLFLLFLTIFSFFVINKGKRPLRGRRLYFRLHVAMIFKYIFICGLAGCFLLVSFLLQNKASTYDKLDNLLSYGPTGKFLVIPSGLPKLKDNQIYINAVLKARVEDSGSIHKRSSQTAKAISGKQSHGFKGGSGPAQDANLNIRVLLSIPNTGNQPKIGAQILADGRLGKLPHGQRNAGFLKAKSITIIQEPQGLLGLVSDFRAHFLNAARNLPSPGGSLLPGLVVGNESLISDNLSQNMKSASLSHLTAVSGSNIALVVGFVILICRAFGIRKLFRIIIALFALSFFVLLVTPQGSVVRASAMAILVLLFDIFGKKILGLKILCVSIFLLLLFDAFYSLDLGFALSVAATFGLLRWSAPIFTWLVQFLPKWLAAGISVPLVAQIACQPVLLLINPSISTYGILANILAAPAAAAATVVGLLAASLLFLLQIPLLNPIAHVFLWIAWAFSHWVGSIANFVQTLPLNTIPWPSGIIGAGLFILACLGIYLLCKPHSTKFALGLKFTIFGSFILLFSASGVFFAFHSFATNPNKPQDPRLIACDVGQGDALLLRGYYNKISLDSIGKVTADRTILIDTGQHKNLLEHCLQLFNISKIDLLILSHFDKDHSYLVGKLNIPILNAIVPDTEEARTVWQTRKLQEMGTKIQFGAKGDSFKIADLELRLLSPWRDQTSANGQKALPSKAKGNASSLTFLAKPTDTCKKSCISSLFLGDTGKNEQIRIDAENKNMHVDIVKMAHHGSADQYPELYKNIKGKLAIISSGMHNSYGHPRPKALTILRDSRTLFLRTDLQSNIAIWTEAETNENPDKPINAWTEKATNQRELEHPAKR